MSYTGDTGTTGSAESVPKVLQYYYLSLSDVVLLVQTINKDKIKWRNNTENQQTDTNIPIFQS